MTPSELKSAYQQANPDGHFFDRATMKAFGDTMRNFGVRRVTALRNGEPVELFELYRRRPTSKAQTSSTYFDDGFAIVYASELGKAAEAGEIAAAIGSKNTTVSGTLTGINVRLYQTVIVNVDFIARRVTLRTGGHITATTARRMNEVAKALGLDYHVRKAGDVLRVHTPGATFDNGFASSIEFDF